MKADLEAVSNSVYILSDRVFRGMFKVRLMLRAIEAPGGEEKVRIELDALRPYLSAAADELEKLVEAGKAEGWEPTRFR